MTRLRRSALATAAFAYGVIVVGFVVRITNSGMGCGPEWPLCNGRVIPAFTDPAVAIEFAHRVAVLGLLGLVALTTYLAWRARTVAGGAGPGGTWRRALWGAGLVLGQALVGAVTVWLDLPVASVVVHLVLALGLVAVYLLLARQAGVLGGRIAPPLPGDGAVGGAIRSSIALAALAIVFGGLTATSGAAAACQGFPLCSGQLWPAGESGLAHIHWTHRLLAYALVLHLAALPLLLARRGGSPRLRIAIALVVLLAIVQAGAGIAMVLTFLPTEWRVLHAAVGTALWAALVDAGWLATPGRAGRA